jgi:hypothetical protein
LDAWFLEAECIQIDSLIAVGSSAKVFKGGYKGMTIAVKKILVRYGNTRRNNTCDWEGVGRVWGRVWGKVWGKGDAHAHTHFGGRVRTVPGLDGTGSDVC